MLATPSKLELHICNTDFRVLLPISRTFSSVILYMWKILWRCHLLGLFKGI